jgi:hypothetical protein
MKTRMHIFVIIALVFVATIIATGISTAPVAADSCVAQLTYPVMPTVYYGSSVPIVVPLSVTCSTYYGTSLYATANLYDTTTGTSLGSLSVSLNSVDGGNVFNGQVGFNLPSSTQGHTVQISASIYASQYGSLITTTSISFLVTNTPQQVTTTTVTQPANEYPYPYQYPNPNPYPYPSPPLQNSQQHHHYFNEQNQTQGSNNSMLVYVAIVAILAAVVIATTGLVIFSQRRPQPQPQPYWIPGPPPPPR